MVGLSSEGTARGDCLNRLAALVQCGVASQDQRNALAAETIGLIRPKVLMRMGSSGLPSEEAMDIIMTATERAMDRISQWDAGKGGWGTWVAAIASSCFADAQRKSIREKSMRERLSGESIDLRQVVPCQAIQLHPDAAYEWDEQIGRWMCDGIAVDSGMLARLRNHLLKYYGLKKDCRKK